MSEAPDRAPTPDETRLLDALDGYVTELRAGGTPDRDAVLARHPDVAEALTCLDDLERLARVAAADATAPAEAPTILTPTPPTDDGPAVPATLPVGDFGNYELLGTLGRGGMGVVYKARHKDLGRVVALKMILADRLASDLDVQRFRTEARAAAGLRHPHIVQVYEAGQVDGQHYFAMQYVDGPSLADRARARPLTPDEAARCMLAVAEAVAYLHGQGVVHRDLKPANILLDGGHWPYVSDFGLVKTLGGSDMTGTGAIVGTPSYMAPEQAAGRKAEVGPLSDVYSLGAILYELLTGRPPFREPTPLDTLVQVLEGEPAAPRTLNPRVPRELELICLKALAKAPEQRYASAAELAEDLGRFLRREVVRARPQGPAQRLARWARQEPGLAVRLGALAAAAAVIQPYYQLAHPVPLAVHAGIMGVLGLWAAVSAAWQALIRRGWKPDGVRASWLATDAAMLTAALVLDEAFNTPLVLCYAVYLVSAGLWFREGFVWYTTALAAAGYVVLWAVGAWRGVPGDSPQYHVIVLVCLGALGLMVVAQVRRVRALSRFYERRPLP